MIQQFNNLTIFVQMQILQQENLKQRAAYMKRVIKLGDRFRDINNFNSLCAIFSALNSAPIHRLKEAWAKLSKVETDSFEQFKNIFSRDFNHRNLRQIFQRCTPPTIPHIGLFLQDLVFIDDGNTSTIKQENFGQKSMLNFSKSVRTAERIKTIRLYQNHSYKFEEDEECQKVLQEEFDKYKEITEDQIWDLSTQVRDRDRKKK